ncbi:MAG: hypothetical protein K2K12_05735 [Clostridia bacterium]|nr:hypothetical protein [Clostridia bacterium]
MAQKKKTQRTRRTNTYSKQGVLRALSFFGILLAAIVFTVGGILNWCGQGGVTSILNLIAQICLLIAVAIPAWDYVRGKNKTWQVIFWIALVIYVFGCVFGVIGFYVKK